MAGATHMTVAGGVFPLLHGFDILLPFDVICSKLVGNRRKKNVESERTALTSHYQPLPAITSQAWQKCYRHNFAFRSPLSAFECPTYLSTRRPLYAYLRGEFSAGDMNNVQKYGQAFGICRTTNPAVNRLNLQLGRIWERRH